ncbi:MAG: ATP-dependent helicase [Dissulfurimicrobium sp.]|uniref:ATP-dependent helicase n=1 Tax=Dissulfurimicrobium sp. TaxID=2022436 RepID=UPI004048FF89
MPMSALWSNGLNQAQLDAVTFNDGPLLVIAGPGTGKTRVLAHRIAYLIAEQGIRPEEILVLTFTNKAAREIRDRVCLLLTGYEADASMTSIGRFPWLGTFHAWALRFLRNELGPAAAMPVDEDTAFKVFKDAAAAAGLDSVELKGLFDFVMRVKEGATVDTAGDERLRLAYDAYQSAMRQKGLWDYADLLIEALQLLRLHEVKQRFREKIHHILVDEFQDVNWRQYTLIKEMALTAADGPEITVIGDPRQAIYGFRGADSAFIARFSRDFAPVKTITLDTVYRCPQIILDAAASVIGESGKGLISVKGQGHKITLKTFKNDFSEARWIARTIENMTGPTSLDSINMSAVAGQMMNLSDVAVLFRINAISAMVEHALKERGIPYKMKAMPDVPEMDIKIIGEVWGASEGVSLLSIHASKGLEFKAVFIIGCEDGVMPWKNGDMAEEERLFYVGITRASERLFLCVSKERTLCAMGDKLRPSRFLSRIPSEFFAAEEKERTTKPRRPRQKGLF